MANLGGYISIAPSDTTAIDSSAQMKVGTRAFDKDGNEYIYLLGVASTVEHSWVNFDEAGITTLLAANAQGRVAIAMAATVADKYGWYQIYGKGTGKVLAGFVDNGKVFCTSTAGSVDDADVSGDFVVGAIGRSAVASGVATMELNYPIVQDTVFD